jgi:hypothetical protein
MTSLGPMIVMIAVFGVLSAGCSHVVLRAPGKSAPLATRIEAAHRLSPRKLHIKTVTTRTTIDYETTSSSYDVASLELRDGRYVRRAEDLLPVVDSSSETARFARKEKTLRKVSRWLWSLAGVSAVGGTALGVALADPENPGPARAVAFSGLSVAIVLLIADYAFVVDARYRAKLNAFDNYCEDLVAHLEVCVDGLAIVACSKERTPPHARCTSVTVPNAANSH